MDGEKISRWVKWPLSSDSTGSQSAMEKIPEWLEMAQ
jgi:hypothetical protein